MTGIGHIDTGLRSMRARMTTLFALLVALLMFAGGAIIQDREERRAERRVDETLSVAVELTYSEIDEEDNEKLPLNKIPLETRGEIATGDLVLVVVDSKGRTLWRSRRVAPSWPVNGYYWRYKTISRLGQTLVVARDWRPIEEELREMQLGLWLLGCVIVPGTAIVAWFVVGQTLSPLGKLAAQAENASIESLQVRLHSPSSDIEMQHLTATLNHLLERLEKEAQARGRFYAAASHELRTPIQVLLGEVDVVRSRVRTPAEYEAALAQVQEHTERLAQIVSDLLQLNALEMRQSQAPLESLNLTYWVERATHQQEIAAGERGQKFESELDDAPIEAPPIHLEMLLRNLVENAVKYGEPDSTIRITIERRSRHATLGVWNSCRPSSDIDPEAWFEAFYRNDVSRSSEVRGNGLGLAICRAICMAHGWKIGLEWSDGGVLAEVKFPLQASSDSMTAA